MEQTTKRLDYLDAAKGLALLLVIFGHTFRESMRDTYTWCALSYDFVYRFHVSLLFVVSGMSYAITAEKNQRLRPAQYLKRKARALLLPWLSYSLLIYIVFAAAWMLPPCRRLLASTAYRLIPLQDYAVALLYNENPYSFHLWYLQTLFLFIAVTFLLDRFLPPRAALTAKLALLVLTPLFYELFCQSWVWTFKGFFQKYFCFLLGVLVPSSVVEHKAGPLAAIGAASGAYLLMRLLYPSVTLYDSTLRSLLQSCLENLAIAGLCFGILAVSVLLRGCMKSLAHFGQDTMLYYLYHQPFCCAVLGMVLYDRLHVPAVLTVAVCMAASLAGPALFRMIVRRCGLQGLLKKIGLPC